jgi:hypothetical protein
MDEDPPLRVEGAGRGRCVVTACFDVALLEGLRRIDGCKSPHLRHLAAHQLRNAGFMVNELRSRPGCFLGGCAP